MTRFNTQQVVAIMTRQCWPRELGYGIRLTKNATVLSPTRLWVQVGTKGSSKYFSLPAPYRSTVKARSLSMVAVARHFSSHGRDKDRLLRHFRLVFQVGGAVYTASSTQCRASSIDNLVVIVAASSASIGSRASAPLSTTAAATTAGVATASCFASTTLVSSSTAWRGSDKGVIDRDSLFKQLCSVCAFDGGLCLFGSGVLDEDVALSKQKQSQLVTPSFSFLLPPAAISRHPRPVGCLLYTSPSPRDGLLSRMPSSA